MQEKEDKALEKSAEKILEKVRVKKKHKDNSEKKGASSQASPYTISMPPIRPFLKEL